MANDVPVLHLVVIGFHHKKGYQVRFTCKFQNFNIYINGINSVFGMLSILSQVDYAYPPLFSDQPNDSVECPDGWKYLPTLALPDGSHNFEEDTVFFNLPSLNDSRKTVYGISCYVRIRLFLVLFFHVIRIKFILFFSPLFLQRQIPVEVSNNVSNLDRKINICINWF